jgi:hypothetical protein
MPITVTEKSDSRPGSTGQDASADLHYTIRGTADDAAAKAALLATAPATHGGLVRQTARIEPVRVDESDAAGSIWEGTVRYGCFAASPPPETGDSSFSFDTGGGTQHITQALASVARYPASAPDFKGAIGYDGENIEGVEITVPVYNWSETHYVADGVVTDAYKQTLANLTGTVNNAAFRGFAAGEVLFLGASGSKRGDADWEVTFRFARTPNRVNFTVGDIAVASKKGWEYMWIRYAAVSDLVAKVLVRRPASVHIEKVYPDGDFAGLGI